LCGVWCVLWVCGCLLGWGGVLRFYQVVGLFGRVGVASSMYVYIDIYIDRSIDSKMKG